ncbi:MAG: hypothetical protein KKA70_14955 [Proteobacteria bacterium]|nr:hypothetical protein [Pseudomonadota bacterium]
MKTNVELVSLYKSLVSGLRSLSFALVLIFLCSLDSFAQEEPQIIEITQIACQFLEFEGKNYNFVTTRKTDCESINKQTLNERAEQFKPLELKSGDYIFRVKNVNVPYQIGFYIRSARLVDRLRLPKISGGGLYRGVTKDYPIHLKAGEYLFSCPLNPTPDYRLIVTD